MTKGKFLVLEGADSVGKTTQIKIMAEYLKNQGFKVITLREPGGSVVGEMIRNVLLNNHMDRLAELLLFTASRVELIKTVINPALDDGTIVICDRFTDSTYAYQGHGRGLINEVHKLKSIIDELVQPDHILFINLSLEEAATRLEKRSKTQPNNRLDNLDPEIKERINRGYKEAMLNHGSEAVVISGDGSIELVSARIQNWLDKIFIPKNSHLKKADTNA